MSVCDTVLNYNSLVLGGHDMFWDGTGFLNEFYGSFVGLKAASPSDVQMKKPPTLTVRSSLRRGGCEYPDIGTPTATPLSKPVAP